MASASDMGFASQDYNESMPAQYNFANQFDLENPEQARASYMRLIHEHTKSQLESATNSAARRRASAGEHPMGGLRPESSNSSVDSRAS